MNLQLSKWIVRCGGAIAAAIALLCFCTGSPVSEGGGSRGGNPVVVGMITDDQGFKARNVRVSLIHENYNPLTDSLKGAVTSASTDSTGKYSITAPDSGLYNIEAFEKESGTRLVRFKVKTIRDSICVVPDDTLRKPGTLKVALPEVDDLTSCYVYVPGTTISNRVNKNNDTLILDSVPQGLLPIVCFGRINSAEKSVIRHDVSIVSNNITEVKNPDWDYSKTVILNTSSSGAAVKANVYNFPVLIRLTQDNFDFEQAQGNGTDISFTTSLGAPLSFEIEQWDAVSRLATIWVKVDTVYGSNNSQSITMYWGNLAAKKTTGSATVFDTAAGYQGVWHFNDSYGTTLRDATVNGFAGVSPDSAKPAVGEGVCGSCRVFDGLKSFVSIPNSADSKLNFAETANYTISAWVYADVADSMPHVIVAKGYDQYFLRCTGLSTVTPLWAFSQLGENNIWQACTTTAKNRQWTLITAVRQGTKQLLYCNGTLVDSNPNVFTSANFSRNTSSDVSIGRYLKAVNVPDFNNGFCFFKGSIDEVRMLNVAQSPEWVLLCYLNQGFSNRLVVFKK